MKLLAHGYEQLGVHLVVEKAVHLEYAAGQDFAVGQYALLEKLHGGHVSYLLKKAKC